MDASADPRPPCCDGCRHLMIRACAKLLPGSASGLAPPMEPQNEVERSLLLRCSHVESVAAAADAGAESTEVLIVEHVDGIDHAVGTRAIAVVTEYRGAVSSADTGPTPRPEWCRGGA